MRGQVLLREYAKRLICSDYQIEIDKKNMQIIVPQRFIDYHFVSMYQLLHYGDGLSVDEWAFDWTCSHFKEEDLFRVIKILQNSFDLDDYDKRIKEAVKIDQL